MAKAQICSSSKVVIVGCGCFGISTALHLSERGYKDVTILDRAPTLPAIDAASTDLNKIIRSSYHDTFYTRLAREAIAAWRNRSEWGDLYHESGVLVFGVGEGIYASSAYANDIASGARVKKLVPQSVLRIVDNNLIKKPGEAKPCTDNIISVHDAFPAGIHLGSKFTSAHGFLNLDGGWAYAEGGVAKAIDKVRSRGGKILSSKEVVRLLKSNDGSKTKGVLCKDGSSYEADIVVLATGSWTASAFPALKLGDKCLSTGQSLATIQLTPEEASLYRSAPVVLDFGSSGFYVFPPNENNIVKFAKHAGGFTNFVPTSDEPGAPKISTPRTVLSHGSDGLKIPKAEARFLRDCLREVYPELAKKPFAFTRLCWYTDSPDADWVIDVHPQDHGLALATAGSGHGYKFLPIIGKLIADRLEGKMDAHLQKKFALDRPTQKRDPHRDGQLVKELNTVELCGPDCS